jgi:PAS domain-containing protein
VLHEVATAAHTTATTEEALSIALRVLAEYAEWPIAQVWVVDPESGELGLSGICHVSDPERFRELLDSQRNMRIPSGEGLPGMALEQRRPIWLIIPGPGEELNYLPTRSPELVQATGLRSAVAVPIALDERVVMVIEFGSDEPEEPSQVLFELLDRVGFHLGVAMERHRADEQLKGLLASAPVGMVTVDEAGIIMLANTRACEQFGYENEELVGMQVEALVPGSARTAHAELRGHFLKHPEQLDQVAERDPELAAVLRALADRFEYATLKALLT